MNRNTFKLFLLIIVSAAIPQANAQYAGRMPSDSMPLASPENPFASTTPPLTSKAVAAVVPGATVSALKPLVRPARNPAAPSAPTISAPKGATQVINPSSTKLAPLSASSGAVSAFPGSKMGRYSYMKAPVGSKKGHWQDAPVFSMSGMPTWVEDK